MVAPDYIDWMTLRSHFKSHAQTISGGVFERVLDKCSKYWVPAVAVGAFSTTAALVAGMYKCVAGRERTSQMMMRTRVLAQGFTLAALVVGCMNNTLRHSETDNEPLPQKKMARAMLIPIK